MQQYTVEINDKRGERENSREEKQEVKYKAYSMRITSFQLQLQVQDNPIRIAETINH